MQSPSVLRLAIAAAVSTALFSSTADAHGYLVQPAASSKDTTYNAKIDSSTLPAPYAGKKWNDNPAANAKTFADAFKASGEKSIRAMMDKAAPDCGKTSTTGTPIDVSSMKTVKWANDQEKVGFVKSHTGPCETYIDDVMVQQDMECVSKYPMYPADIPVDYSACKGKCVLTFYWLALHEPQWQVYKQCAPITNGGGGGGGGGAAGGAAGNSTSGGNTGGNGGGNGGGNTGGNNKPPGGNGGNGGGNAPAPVPSKPSNPAPAPAPAPATKPGCKRRVRN